MQNKFKALLNYIVKRLDNNKDGNGGGGDNNRNTRGDEKGRDLWKNKSKIKTDIQEDRHAQTQWSLVQETSEVSDPGSSATHPKQTQSQGPEMTKAGNVRLMGTKELHRARGP